MEKQIDVDRDTMELIAVTYRSRRRAGGNVEQSAALALEAYRQLYPDHTQEESVDVVRRIIATADQIAPAWLLEGAPID